MKRVSKYDKWLQLFPWQHEREVICPNYKSETIDYCLIGNLEERIGFCLIWYSECLKGINISRIRIPEVAKAMSFDEAEN